MSQTVEQLSTALTRLQHERAIERVIFLYGHTLDFDTPEAYAQLFTEDAVVEIHSAVAQVLKLQTPFPEASVNLLVGRGAERTADGFAFKGHAALKRFVTHERTVRSLHVCSQPLVTLDADEHAHAVSYLRIYRHVPGGSVELTNFGRYLDRFKQTADGWRISHRICEL